MGDGGFEAARVVAARHLARGIRHITLAAPSLAAAPPPPGAETALRFPADDGSLEERHYSIWKSDPVASTLDLCVVLHRLGPGSRWAERCAAGDALELEVSRTLPIPLASSAGLHLFLGDETSIATADALLRVLPSGARGRACFEIASPDNRWPDEALADPAAVEWTERDGRPGMGLLSWLGRQSFPDDGQRAAYVTGETWLCTAVHSRLVHDLGFAPRAVRALPFWKRRAPA